MRHRRWPAKSSVPIGVSGGLVLAGTALLTFQGGLLRVALPVIRADLDAGIPAIQLVSLAGLVVVTITLVTFGRLADLLGPGRIYIWGLLGVALGGVLAAAAPTTGLLVAALAGQGVGWSMCAGAGPPLLVSAVPRQTRGRALAAYHMAVAVGLGAGPAGGGLLTDVIGWRGALALTVLLAVPLAATLRSHAPSEGSRGRLSGGRFDLPGAALLGLALAALLLLVRRPTWIPLPIPVILGGAAASFAAFLVRELRTETPLVDLRLFARRGFSAGLAATFLNFIAMAANMFLMPFFLQEHRGHSATTAGVLMATVPVAILATAPLAGRATDRVGSRLPATAGLGLVTLGVTLMAALDRNTPLVGVVAVLVVYGIGAAFFQSPNITGVLDTARDERIGVASGSLSTVGRLGQVTGIAVAGTVWDILLAPPDIAPDSPLPFQITFLVLAGFGAAAALASWLRGPTPDMTRTAA